MPGPALRLGTPPADPSARPLSKPARWFAAGWTDGRSGSRHSRRVALLRRLLPATGVTLLLLTAAWPRLAPLWDRMRLAFPAIDLRYGRELKMVNPRYAGIDRFGRPFVVTAVSGRQVPDRQDLMSLKDPRADLKAHNGADVVITAAAGVYQSQAQLLDLMGGVTLQHQNGTRFITSAARVYAGNDTAEGNAPVAGHGPSGDIRAQGFRILDKGDTILFTGRSDLRLTSARPAAKTPPPPALPRPVAAAAARAAAEAKPALAAAARQSRPRTAIRHRGTSRTAKHQALGHSRVASGQR